MLYIQATQAAAPTGGSITQLGVSLDEAPKVSTCTHLIPRITRFDASRRVVPFQDANQDGTLIGQSVADASVTQMEVRSGLYL